jgi:hypothetical protein
VVALFNAVAKAKREKILSDKKDKPSSKEVVDIDDDDRSLNSFGSLRELQGLHKRPATTAAGNEEAKRPKSNWSVISSQPQDHLAAVSLCLFSL